MGSSIHEIQPHFICTDKTFMSLHLSWCSFWFLDFACLLLCPHEGFTSPPYFPGLILKVSLLSIWKVQIKALPSFGVQSLHAREFLWQVLPCLLSWNPWYGDLTCILHPSGPGNWLCPFKISASEPKARPFRCQSLLSLTTSQSLPVGGSITGLSHLLLHSGSPTFSCFFSILLTNPEDNCREVPLPWQKAV